MVECTVDVVDESIFFVVPSALIIVVTLVALVLILLYQFQHKITVYTTITTLCLIIVHACLQCAWCAVIVNGDVELAVEGNSETDIYLPAESIQNNRSSCWLTLILSLVRSLAMLGITMTRLLSFIQFLPGCKVLFFVFIGIQACCILASFIYLVLYAGGNKFLDPYVMMDGKCTRLFCTQVGVGYLLDVPSLIIWAFMEYTALFKLKIRKIGIILNCVVSTLETFVFIAFGVVQLMASSNNHNAFEGKSADFSMAYLILDAIVSVLLLLIPVNMLLSTYYYAPRSLMEIIELPNGLACFTEFTKINHCSEVLNFYLNVNALRVEVNNNLTRDQKVINNKICKIYETCLDPNKPTSMYIEKSALAQIESELQRAQRNPDYAIRLSVFNKPYYDAKKILEIDTLPEFLKSSIYTRFETEMKVESLANAKSIFGLIRERRKMRKQQKELDGSFIQIGALLNTNSSASM